MKGHRIRIVTSAVCFVGFLFAYWLMQRPLNVAPNSATAVEQGRSSGRLAEARALVDDTDRPAMRGEVDVAGGAGESDAQSLHSAGTDDSFESEIRDPGWATTAEQAILDSMAQIPGVAAASLEVECRTTMCRVAVAFASERHLDEYLPRVNRGLGTAMTRAEFRPLIVAGFDSGDPSRIFYFQRADPP